MSREDDNVYPFGNFKISIYQVVFLDGHFQVGFYIRHMLHGILRGMNFCLRNFKFPLVDIYICMLKQIDISYMVRMHMRENNGVDLFGPCPRQFKLPGK